MKCTCGATKAGSPGHSTWCDANVRSDSDTPITDRVKLLIQENIRLAGKYPTEIYMSQTAFIRLFFEVGADQVMSLNGDISLKVDGVPIIEMLMLPDSVMKTNDGTIGDTGL